MRHFMKIVSALSIVAALISATLLLFLYLGMSNGEDISTYNYTFLNWMVFPSILILILAGVNNFMLSSDKYKWLKSNELCDLDAEKRREIAEYIQARSDLELEYAKKFNKLDELIEKTVNDSN